MFLWFSYGFPMVFLWFSSSALILYRFFFDVASRWESPHRTSRTEWRWVGSRSCCLVRRTLRTAIHRQNFEAQFQEGGDSINKLCLINSATRWSRLHLSFRSGTLGLSVFGSINVLVHQGQVVAAPKLGQTCHPFLSSSSWSLSKHVEHAIPLQKIVKKTLQRG